jgi:hypothetical protein
MTRARRAGDRGFAAFGARAAFAAVPVATPRGLFEAPGVVARAGALGAAAEIRGLGFAFRRGFEPDAGCDAARGFDRRRVEVSPFFGFTMISDFQRNEAVCERPRDARWSFEYRRASRQRATTISLRGAR